MIAIKMIKDTISYCTIIITTIISKITINLEKGITSFLLTCMIDIAPKVVKK